MSSHRIADDFAPTRPDPELEDLRKRMINVAFRARLEGFSRGFLAASVPFVFLGWCAAMLFKELSK